jgi:hypothetical protein
MAYPNFKKGLKMAFGPLGVKKKRQLQHCTFSLENYKTGNVFYY